MESQLVEALEELSIDAGEQMAEDLREEMVDNLRLSYQEAPELVNFISDVHRVGDEFHIEVNHPTAPLHERGGHIEPTYARAASVGWTRDEFYETLTDCNEWVERKGYTMDAMITMKAEWGGQ